MLKRTKNAAGIIYCDGSEKKNCIIGKLFFATYERFTLWVQQFRDNKYVFQIELFLLAGLQAEVYF